MKKTQKHKILVMRLSSLGDIILLSPVFKNIKAKWPDAHITLLVKPQFAQALSGHPDIDTIMVFKGFISTVRAIRAAHFTHLLDLHSTLRTRLLTLFSGVANKARYNKHSLQRRLHVKFKLPSPALEKHTLEKYLEALKIWDIPVKYTTPKLNDWVFRPADIDRKEVENICIFQTSFIGDSVLTTPLVQKTAALFPKAKITIVTRPQTAEIFQHLKEVSEIIIDDKRGLGKITGVWKTSKAVRQSRADVILVPHRSFRSALIAKLSGVKVRIGFTNSEGRFFYTKTVPFSWMIHDAERNLYLLQGIVNENFKSAELNMQNAGANAGDSAAKMLADAGLEGKTLAGVHPGSVWPTKCWPYENYAKLITRLERELGVISVIVGGSKDIDLGEQVSRLSDAHPVNLAGKTTLSELMALMKHFKLFVTNDSGPMHIAAAFGVPVLAIFGPTTKELGFFPYGEGNRVIEVKGLPCRPCALHGGKKCPQGHFKCMRNITMDEVFAAAREMLGK
ncbi:MAG: lipopolysaccharide heptosyltransferase II [Elusimicrobiota bacterium]|jgi:heptosyltransferase-2|nr:lipopolysaccharide heptosyltransferase II [Elusimicrobiota bacterium]